MFVLPTYPYHPQSSTIEALTKSISRFQSYCNQLMSTPLLDVIEHTTVAIPPIFKPARPTQIPDGAIGSESDNVDVDSLPPNAILRRMLITKTVQHPDGRILPLTSAVSPHNAKALYQTLLSRRAKCVIEIGMAFGASTLSALTALDQLGGGEMISIDPYPNWDTGKRVAKHQIELAGFSKYHRHYCEKSFSALPKLLADGVQADLVYIDGMHTFDHAFVDFFYGDKLIRPGGVIAFNDCGWRSVFRVIRFLLTHRKYVELDVGIPLVFRGRNRLFSLLKRVEGRSSGDRYFEKLTDWEPECNFYSRF